MDIHAYRAKQFRDRVGGAEVVPDHEEVYRILVAKGEVMKREEIVDRYIKSKGLDPEAAAHCVNYALKILVKNKRVDKWEHGMYTAR